MVSKVQYAEYRGICHKLLWLETPVAMRIYFKIRPNKWREYSEQQWKTRFKIGIEET